MSERKVLNKYYPPDYDPSKIPRIKGERSKQFCIRVMAPFNMRCDSCGEYIYKGKKFNSRMENVEGESYLGIPIRRFYIKCPRCVSEITFRTDPESVDYAPEHGSTRLFEALRTAEKMAEAEEKRKLEEEADNPMKQLEKRTTASQREIEMLETLEELKELNARHASLDHEQLLDVNVNSVAEKLDAKLLAALQEEEDERLVKEAFGGKSTAKRAHGESSSDESDNDSHEDREKIERERLSWKKIKSATSSADFVLPAPMKSNVPKVGLVVRRGQNQPSANLHSGSNLVSCSKPSENITKSAATAPVSRSLQLQYSSSDESDE